MDRFRDMPLTSLVAFVSLAQLPAGSSTQFGAHRYPDQNQGIGPGPGRPAERPIQCGWQDDLDNIGQWKHLVIDNKPKVTAPYPGTLRLSLGKVPSVGHTSTSGAA